MPNPVQINSPANVPYDADNPMPVSATLDTSTISTEDTLADARDQLVTLAAAAQDTSPVNVVGDIAHDAAAGGAPVLMGGRAKSANFSSVADADATYAWFDTKGRLVAVVGLPRDLKASAVASRPSSTTAADLVAAQGAGVFADITEIVFENKSATGTEVVIYDADDTTERARFYVPPTDTRGVVLGRGILKGAAANAAWRWKTVTSVDTVYATVFFNKETA